MNMTVLEVYELLIKAIAVAGVLGSGYSLLKKGFDKITEPLNKLDKKVDTLQSSVSALTNGTKASLCEGLIRRAKEYKSNHYVGEEDYKRFVEDYLTYKNIGGNGYVDDLKESIEKLYARGANYDK